MESWQWKIELKQRNNFVTKTHVLTKCIFPTEQEIATSSNNNDTQCHIQIPYGISHIGIGAFLDCSLITEITIPSTVTHISKHTFQNCSSLKTITLPSSIKGIGTQAFASCVSLTTFTIPKSVTYIGHSVFEKCTAMERIDIPENIKYIPASMFKGCESLKNITIHEGITMIGDEAFAGCSSLVKIIPSERRTKEQNTTDGFITIPKTVTLIGQKAFMNCAKLTKVTVPHTITTLGFKAFSSCKSLETVTIPTEIEIPENSQIFAEPSGSLRVVRQGITFLSTLQTRDEIHDRVYQAKQNYIYFVFLCVERMRHDVRLPQELILYILKYASFPLVEEKTTIHCCDHITTKADIVLFRDTAVNNVFIDSWTWALNRKWTTPPREQKFYSKKKRKLDWLTL
eukprot:m.44063 g.44063  ORF g.44063 m.44063 type:complete len:399 (+) comp10043_c0_seq4:91-1287(+)